MGGVIIDRPSSGLLDIAMSNPKNKNAMSRSMRQGLHEALDEGLNDASVRAIILRGADGNFSAGGDIGDFALQTSEETANHLDALRVLLMRIHTSPKPVVAAIEGVAAGGSIGLALACDWVIAADDARLVFSFPAIGLVPDMGLTATLPARMGQAAARRVLYQKRSVLSGAEAYTACIVDDSVPASSLQAAACGRAEELGALPDGLFAATKALLNGPSTALDAVLQAEFAVQNQLFAGTAFREQARAFLSR